MHYIIRCVQKNRCVLSAILTGALTRAKSEKKEERILATFTHAFLIAKELTPVHMHMSNSILPFWEIYVLHKSQFYD